MTQTVNEPLEGTAKRRRCIVTGVVDDRRQMVRFVLDPGQRIVADVDGRLPGRGVWVQAKRPVLLRACARGVFARAFHRPVEVSADLCEQVERLLRRRIIELVGLANRAGQAAFGFEKCRQWLAAGRGAVLLAASDGSLAERARLRGAADVRMSCDVLTAAELGRAIGRAEVVHGIVAGGRLAERLVIETARLRGIIGCDSGPAAVSNG
ncbi:MAG: RNA-binding protein [Rhodospirillales bacterium]|jgi:hypothetical protein|nr:RNA-binding protein [Rhodospirillales bacterium]